jgi:hypothetical protein
MLGTYFGQSTYKGVVHGINLINEPFPIETPKLKQFYLDGYQNVRRAENQLSVSISDGFLGVNPWYELF